MAAFDADTGRDLAHAGARPVELVAEVGSLEVLAGFLERQIEVLGGNRPPGGRSEAHLDVARVDVRSLA